MTNVPGEAPGFEVSGPVKPELGNGIELPAIPLPWQPLERMRVANEAFEGAYKSVKSDEEFSALREYMKWAEGRYLLPGHAVEVVRNLTDFDESLTPVLFTHQSEEDYTSMMQRFEQQHLGLEPNSSSDGLRWWASAAGFSSGRYPADAVGKLLDMTGPELLDSIKREKGAHEWVVIKSDNYLIPLIETTGSDDSVTIDGVTELTPAGLAILEKALRAYELGLEAKLTDHS